MHIAAGLFALAGAAIVAAWAWLGMKVEMPPSPLGAGEKYYVKEIGETGWTQTFGTAGDIITPTSGTDSTTNNFANFKQFTISGIKYTDVNGLDANTSIGGDDTAGTPGQTFTINLYDWKDTALNPGVVDASELTQLATTETDATTGACEQCAVDGDCSGTTPFCDTTSGRCVACVAEDRRRGAKLEEQWRGGFDRRAREVRQAQGPDARLRESGSRE